MPCILYIADNVQNKFTPLCYKDALLLLHAMHAYTKIPIHYRDVPYPIPCDCTTYTLWGFISAASHQLYNSCLLLSLVKFLNCSLLNLYPMHHILYTEDQIVERAILPPCNWALPHYLDDLICSLTTIVNLFIKIRVMWRCGLITGKIDLQITQYTIKFKYNITIICLFPNKYNDTSK